MYVKLAFSVAAHLDSEIMIMDEVLAVGDMAFQKKCLDKMRDAAKQEGRTVLYVSHNMNTIRQLCDRCVVLDKGEVRQLGTAREMYYTPGSEFVARLFGEPEINLLPAQFSVSDGEGWIALPDGVRYKLPEDAAGRLPEELLELACRGRGWLLSGGRCDTERAVSLVLDEFRAGKLGRITLETPEE